jgi:hypothetical protein
MIFRFRDAPEWFTDHICNYYTKELHTIQKAANTEPTYSDQKFKKIAVNYFISKGFTVWLDQENHICFDIDQNSSKWTFEILRG